MGARKILSVCAVAEVGGCSLVKRVCRLCAQLIPSGVHVVDALVMSVTVRVTLSSSCKLARPKDHVPAQLDKS